MEKIFVGNGIEIVKTPVLDFKDIEQSEEILERDALDSWLSELI